MTAPVTIKRMEHTSAELRELAVRSRDAAQSRRLLAIALVLDGSSRDRLKPGGRTKPVSHRDPDHSAFPLLRPD